MRQLNRVYAQGFNRGHRKVGHLFQGRFKAILVERGSYLLELARYVALNPLRAKMVKAPKDLNGWQKYKKLLINEDEDTLLQICNKLNDG